MALPCGTTGSLCSSFLPDRLVGLSVKHPCAITLSDRLPIGLRVPLEASVTLLEATTPVKLPTKQCPRSCELALKHSKVRISTAAPRRLASPARSLRTILHIKCPNAMLSCSKGSRGLFVPLRVIGIFTDTTISPKSRLRQCPDHYTIRAGRNLPDKEFRYLRTVIVTAAVYRFNSPSLAISSLLNLPAPGRCQAVYFIFKILHSPVFLLNSCLDLFSAPYSLGTLFSWRLQGQFALVP